MYRRYLLDYILAYRSQFLYLSNKLEFRTNLCLRVADRNDSLYIIIYGYTADDPPEKKCVNHGLHENRATSSILI